MPDAAEALERPERARAHYRRFLQLYPDAIEDYREEGSKHVPELEATRERALARGLDASEGGEE